MTSHAENSGRPEGTPSDGDRDLSPFVVGYAWVSRVTAYSAEFAILVWFGRWFDVHYGFAPWAMLAGVAIGLFAFVSGIVQTVKRLEDEETRERLREVSRARKKPEKQ